MSIDWQHFTPWTSLAGGVLIGASAAALYVFSNRIAGISGIFSAALLNRTSVNAWRWAFLLGLVIAPWLLLAIRHANTVASPINSTINSAATLFAGVLTGFGTYLAKGCTSGHGVCGLARLSPRSLVAVLCFMGSGMVTVTLIRHWL
jgi:uncharacterized membrane protein YedE/YeeE